MERKEKGKNMSKWVYLFEEGNADMRNLLGGKGANLAEMTNLGLPIPQGFTVTTEAGTDYYNNGRQISEEIRSQIFEALANLEEKQGKKFGDTKNPLLVSVRSGARASWSVALWEPCLFFLLCLVLFPCAVPKFCLARRKQRIP